jgi:hypothetical protein
MFKRKNIIIKVLAVEKFMSANIDKVDNQTIIFLWQLPEILINNEIVFFQKKQLVRCKQPIVIGK